MDSTFLLEALVQEKRMYALLNEVMDLSVQLAQAVDRDDKVSVNMLMGMRADPVRKLQNVRKTLEMQRDRLEPNERARFAELLNGEPAEIEEERALADQISTNRRLFSRVIDFDERINRKIAKDDSIYG